MKGFIGKTYKNSQGQIIGVREHIQMGMFGIFTQLDKTTYRPYSSDYTTLKSAQFSLHSKARLNGWEEAND
jgi:hypothetical protein